MSGYPERILAAADYLGRLEQGVERLRFCRQVYTDFVVNGKEPTFSGMNSERATAQLIEAVDSLLEEASKH